MRSVGGMVGRGAAALPLAVLVVAPAGAGGAVCPTTCDTACDGGDLAGAADCDGAGDPALLSGTATVAAPPPGAVCAPRGLTRGPESPDCAALGRGGAVRRRVLSPAKEEPCRRPRVRSSSVASSVICGS